MRSVLPYDIGDVISLWIRWAGMMQLTERHSQQSLDWMDRAAIAGSLACMVHCLILPLILAALPALSSLLAVPEAFHLWMLAVAVPAAAVALVAGRARHGAAWPLWLGATGCVLLVLGGIVLEEGGGETVFTVIGSLSLAGAHVANWRLRRICRHEVEGTRSRL